MHKAQMHSEQPENEHIIFKLSLLSFLKSTVFWLNEHDWKAGEKLLQGSVQGQRGMCASLVAGVF